MGQSVTATKISATQLANSVISKARNATHPDPHALSETVPGHMSEDEFNALCASVELEGLKHAIVLYEGKVLDGRARLRACIKTGTAPRYKTFAGSQKDARVLVEVNNLQRKTINSMQKALVAARLFLAKELPTQRDAGARVGVSVATVNIAAKLLQSGNQALIRRTENGDTSRSEVAELLYDNNATTTTGNRTLTHETEHAPKQNDNVRDIQSGRAAQQRETQRATETEASRAVQLFKGLNDPDKRSFIEMAWPFLAPQLRKLGKINERGVKTSVGKTTDGKSIKATARKSR